MAEVEVTIYSRRDCHLCEAAMLAIAESGVEVRIVVVDVDDDPQLRRLYTNDVPVILVGAVEAFRHRVTAEEFREFMRNQGPSSNLASEKCVACRGGVPPLQGTELDKLTGELGGGWRVIDEHHLAKDFRFPDFAEALSFTNAVGAIAEREGHHPDLHLSWGKVGVTIWTHKIDGLTRSDFILAAKIDTILPA